MKYTNSKQNKKVTRSRIYMIFCEKIRKLIEKYKKKTFFLLELYISYIYTHTKKVIHFYFCFVS